MRYVRTLLIVVVALAVVPAPTAGDVAGQPELDAVFVDNTVAPGEQTALQVQLLNRGNLTNRSERNPALNREVTTARGLTVTVQDDDVPIDVKTGTQIVGTLPEGTAPPIAVPVSVDENAEPGTYTVDVVVDYTYTKNISDSGNRTEASVRRTIPVELVVEEAPAFEVVSVDSNARVGSTETVAVTVENTGSAAANDTTLTMQSRNAALTLNGASSSSRYVGDWRPGESRTVAYEVTATPRASTQRYAMSLTASYTQGGVPGVSEALSLGVTPAPEQTFAVGNASGTLAVGSEGELRGTVTNTGETPVRNAVVVYASQSPTVTPIETEHPVGDLAPGESADFAIPLEIAGSAEAGQRQFSVTVQYRNAEGEQRRSDTFDLRTEVSPDDPRFALDVERASVTAGEGTTLAVTVTNDGPEPVTDVSAKLFASSPLSTADDEAFIARLAPGESETVTFSVSASSGALAKTYPLSMDFQYTDADGDTLVSDTYRLPLQVTEDEEGGGLPVLPILVALVVVAGVGLYLYRAYG